MAFETDKKGFIEITTYKDAVLKRSSALLQASESQEEAILKFTELVIASKKELKTSVALLKEDLGLLNKQVAESKLIILQSISQMKSAVKKDDFSKLEKRSDVWNPEYLASRTDLKNVISKLH